VIASFRGVFVTGTDTGVGKTRVGCALARSLRARGLDVGVMKPVETGVGAAGPRDALALRAAADSRDALDEICPEALALPAAPAVAARHAGRAVDLERIARAYRALSARHDCVLAEGAGGLLVPLTREFSMADLARRLALPLLVVARAALGTLNHTLLTLEAAVARGLPIRGVVISHAGPELDAGAQLNLDELRRGLGTALLGELPRLAEGAAPPADWIDLERLLAPN
jgi:dethiobiotin synthetase